MSDSLRPHGLLDQRLLCPWDFPGKGTGVGCHFLLQGIFTGPGIESESPALAGRFFTAVPPWKVKIECVPAKSLQSCLTHCDPMDCSPPGSSVHGIFRARILECVAISFSRGSSLPRDLIHVSYIGRRFLPLCHLGLCVTLNSYTYILSIMTL